MTLALIIAGLLGVGLLAMVAAPLVARPLAELLPSDEDPMRRDLEEERDTLYDAIREVEARSDLSEDERARLRARYSAKAARVLRALDVLQPPSAPPKRRGLPLGVVLLVVLMAPSLALVGGFVLPRVGGATVTTNSASALSLGRELRRLEQRVASEPTRDDLLALADLYWQEGTAAMVGVVPAGMEEDMKTFREKAATLYRRLETEFAPAPGVVYQRLGLLALNGESEGGFDEGLRYLERAREAEPQNLDTLYVLGELYYGLERMGAAQDAWESFLRAPGGNAEAGVVEPRLAAAKTLAPLVLRVDDERNAENLLALADAYWDLEERDRAASLYAEVITELEVESARALSRIGQVLFFTGNAEQAVLALERARDLEPDDLDTLLFLGNAYSSLGEDQRAVDVWRRYVTVAGGSDRAGRVPQLIAQAEARLNGEMPSPVTQSPLPASGQASGQVAQTSAAQVGSSGAALFAANCASCHGANGGGGAAPRLAGNPRVADAVMVESTIRTGRGMMPGFGSVLSDIEIETLTRYLAGLAELE